MPEKVRLSSNDGEIFDVDLDVIKVSSRRVEIQYWILEFLATLLSVLVFLNPEGSEYNVTVFFR